MAKSTHKDHKGEIDVLSWNWDVGQRRARLGGGGSGKGKAIPGHFAFMHHYDKASPVLAKNCAQGKHFPSVDHHRAQGRRRPEGLPEGHDEGGVHQLGRAHGAAGGDITESVALSYGYIEFDYKPQDDKGGLGGEVKFGWNVKSTEIS